MKELTRISSTQLSDFETCARKWAFVHADGEDSGVGYAAAVGTVAHAILERRLQHGCDPTEDEVYAMGGNYDPPSKVLDAYGADGIWEEALATAASVGDPWQHIPAVFEEVEVEWDAERWGLSMHGVALGSYFDLFAHDEATNSAFIHDWKTRGAKSWRYRPSSAALATNPQLMYYASLARLALGVDSVVVQHGNMLRAGEGEPRFELVRATIIAPDMDAFIRKLKDCTLPQMQAVHKMWGQRRQRHQVEANTAGCFKYGRCPHMTRCNAIDAAAAPKRSIIDRLHAGEVDL